MITINDILLQEVSFYLYYFNHQSLKNSSNCSLKLSPEQGVDRGLDAHLSRRNV